MLIDVDRLLRAYHDEHPDPQNPAQAVSFGTSGHRGSSLQGTFNEDHIVAISAAIAHQRAGRDITGPLFIGRDTHALSAPAFRTAVEVLVAHGVRVTVDADDGYTPTPAISHAILTHNAVEGRDTADGIVITPSHNPPGDGGFKYNPPHGGPADTDVTRQIQDAANELLRSGLATVKRADGDEAIARAERHDFRSAYVDTLGEVIDLQLIARSGIRLGVDPLGGASVAYWQAIAERYGLNLEVVNDRIDPTFSFMTLDHDGKIRMDCSSPDAMAGLISLKDSFDVAFANDPDADRHGIVTPSGGLMAPNHYLAAAISYLLGDARDFDSGAGVGKTMVSSSMIDRVVAGLGRRLHEVPVGFKWFVPGLLDATLAFGGEESAGASFLRRDGRAWSTDKDGLIMCLLAAEMTVRDGQDPARRYARLTERYGAPAYRRLDAPASAEQKRVLAALSPENVSASELAGEPIDEVLTAAPAGGALGGVKVVTATGWFAARPSGTEDVYKLYAESFAGTEQLERIIAEAQQVVDAALGA
jgi:phosphoglucomutase